jgi:hypothetical protein
MINSCEHTQNTHTILVSVTKIQQPSKSQESSFDFRKLRTSRGRSSQGGLAEGIIRRCNSNEMAEYTALTRSAS